MDTARRETRSKLKDLETNLANLDQQSRNSILQLSDMCDATIRKEVGRLKEGLKDLVRAERPNFELEGKVAAVEGKLRELGRELADGRAADASGGGGRAADVSRADAGGSTVAM